MKNMRKNRRRVMDPVWYWINNYRTTKLKGGRRDYHFSHNYHNKPDDKFDLNSTFRIASVNQVRTFYVGKIFNDRDVDVFIKIFVNIKNTI